MAIRSGPAGAGTPQGHVEAVARPARTTGSGAPDFPTVIACATDRGNVIPVAHRARAGDAQPENSASGIAAALQAGARVLEVDVRQTRDLVLFLHHDETLDRTTTSSGPAGSRSWEDLHGSLLKYDDGRVADERPIRLLEAFRTAPGSTYFMLDLKDVTATRAVVSETIGAGRQHHAAFIAYSIEQAMTIREVLPHALIALGANDRERLRSISESPLGPPIIGLMGSVAEPDTSLVEAARGNGYFLLGGTHVGQPSVEDMLADAQQGDVLARMSSSFTLWVTDGFATVASYLDRRRWRLELGTWHDSMNLSVASVVSPQRLL